jgi:2,4-dienoyl-CoA reductase-like NADH-dependent reductase (Old Yellow Enzyme family)/thioredoxin reductase
VPAEPRPSLATPLRLRGVELRNRVVGAPMERNYSDLAGRATPRYAAYLGARAAGGAALLFTEASYVRQDSKARLHQAGMHDDSVLPGLQAVAAAVHEHGALLGVEVNHAGRVVPSAVSQHVPVGPSPVACAEIGGEAPRELPPAEIDEVVAAYAEAARRAVRGGADVVAVHGAHGYLVGQFVSPRSNRRTDHYAEPTRFLDEVVVAVRDAIGPDVPLFLRWSAFEGLPGGLDADASLRALLGARLDLVDVVDLSAGTYGAGHWITPSGEVEEGYLSGIARRYRHETGLVVSMAGRITSPRAAQRVVEDGDTDLVSVARALHADPEWARHATAGTDPRPCISCNQGCADVIFTGQPLWCTANPATGREEVTPPRPRTTPRRVERAAIVVAGSGPSGLQAALTLAEQGWPVAVHERASRLGGQLADASRLRAKPQFGRLLEWYLAELRRRGVELHPDSEVTPELVAEHATGVVDATGGADYLPAVAGDGAHRLVGLRTWLAAGIPDRAGSVTVWGADRCGVYLADHLHGLGWSVTVAGAQRELAPDAGARERLPAVERLTDGGVDLHLGATVDAVDLDALVLTAAGTRRVIPSDGPVVVSLGAVPVGLGPTVPVPVVPAGEAAGSGPLDAAVASGDAAARQLVARLTGSGAVTAC